MFSKLSAILRLVFLKIITIMLMMIIMMMMIIAMTTTVILKIDRDNLYQNAFPELNLNRLWLGIPLATVHSTPGVIHSDCQCEFCVYPEHPSLFWGYCMPCSAQHNYLVIGTMLGTSRDLVWHWGVYILKNILIVTLKKIFFGVPGNSISEACYQINKERL